MFLPFRIEEMVPLLGKIDPVGLGSQSRGETQEKA